jgi:putative ATPase
MTEPGLFERSTEPLAARMRPRKLEDIVGQEHLLGSGKPLEEAIRRGDIGSCILWGPPGSGKTTLARIVAHYTDRHFEPFSAVTEGVARVREIIKEAEERLKYQGRGTILFCDEIHRFNRAQQDAFLPWVESGVITLIGATTENPSFELTGALLSRCRVFVLEPLRDADVRVLIQRALTDPDAGLGALQLEMDEDALAVLAREADGDARRALQAIEVASRGHAPDDSRRPPEALREVRQEWRGALQPHFGIAQGGAGE